MLLNFQKGLKTSNKYCSLLEMYVLKNYLRSRICQTLILCIYHGIAAAYNCSWVFFLENSALTHTLLIVIPHPKDNFYFSNYNTEWIGHVQPLVYRNHVTNSHTIHWWQNILLKTPGQLQHFLKSMKSFIFCWSRVLDDLVQ